MLFYRSDTAVGKPWPEPLSRCVPFELGLEGMWTENAQIFELFELRRRQSWKVCREILELCGMVGGARGQALGVCASAKSLAGQCDQRTGVSVTRKLFFEQFKGFGVGQVCVGVFLLTSILFKCVPHYYCV